MPASHASFPDELTRVPGLLGEATDWIEENTVCPNRPLAFAAALSAVSLALSGKVGFRGIGPEINVLAVGPSASGKTDALHRARTLLERAGLGDSLCGGFASPEAVRDARAAGTSLLWIEEHFGLDARNRRLAPILDRAFADEGGAPVVLHAHCVPAEFPGVVETLAGRAVAIVVAHRSTLRERPDTAPVPDALADRLARWRAVAAMREAEIAPEAATLRMEREADHKARRCVLADKLALLHAASESGPDGKPHITRAAVEWAWRVIDIQPDVA